MAKTRSMTRNQNQDQSSSSRKSSKTFDNGDVASWSDVNHDVLYIVMMQLGFADFFAFSRVCKSWRSLALSNKNTFMMSKPPMSIRNIMEPNKDDLCHLEDFEGTKFKTIIPHFTNRACVGSTCGYLILFGKETRDFWLVNPITRHELHFPDYSIYIGVTKRINGILVFSPSLSGWVFVLLNKNVSFCIAGKRGWTHVSFTLPIVDLHVYKGKIYTLHKDCSLCELRLDRNKKRKWMLIETKNLPKPYLFKPWLVSFGENLYVMNYYGLRPTEVWELDFGEMKWVLPGKKIEEYAFFVSYLNYSAAVIKVDSRVGSQTKHKSYGCFIDNDKSRKCLFYYERMWYFPHDCLRVNHLDE